MAPTSDPTNFAHIQDDKLREIIFTSLSHMAKLLEETPCLSSTSLADQLSDLKKEAFEQMYAIGRETMDRDLSEEVLKAIRAMQDVFGQIIVAISPMDNLRHCLQHIWLNELSQEEESCDSNGS